MPLDTRTVFVSLGIDVAVASAVLIGFTLLRSGGLSARFYAPNRFKRRTPRVPSARGGLPLLSEGEEESHRRAPPLPSNPLAWLTHVWWLSERDVLKYTGSLDAAVYLRVLRLGIYISLLLSVWCCAVILPINITGGALDKLLQSNAGAPPGPIEIRLGPGALGSNAALQLNQELNKVLNSTYADTTNNNTSAQGSGPLPPTPDPGSAYVFSDFDKMALANVKPRSDRLWGHVVSMYVITAAILHLLWQQCKSVAALRIAYMAGVFDPARPEGDDQGPAEGQDEHALLPSIESSANLVLPARALAAVEGHQQDVSSQAVTAVQQKGSSQAQPGASFQQPGPVTEAAQPPAGPSVPQPAGRAMSQAAMLKSIASRSVIITDIPGTASHTHLAAVRRTLWTGTLARVLPRSWRHRIERMVAGATHGVTHELSAAALAAVRAATSAASGGRRRTPPPREGELPQSTQAADRRDEEVGLEVERSGDSVTSTRSARQAGSPSPSQPLLSRQQLRSHLQQHQRATGHPSVSTWARAEAALLEGGLTFPEMVAQELREVYGEDQLTGLVVLRDQEGTRLGSLVASYTKAKEALLDLVDAYASRIANGRHVKRATIRIVPPLHGSWAVEQYGSAPVRVDALHFRIAQITALKARIGEERLKHLAQGQGLTPAAAVQDGNQKQQQEGASIQGSTAHLAVHMGGVKEEGSVPGPQQQSRSLAQGNVGNASTRPVPHVSALEEGAHAPAALPASVRLPALAEPGAQAGGDAQQVARQAAAVTAAGYGVAAAAGGVGAGGEMSEEAARRAAAAKYLPTAIATFKSRWAAAVASMALHAHNEEVWRIQPAPEPGDLLWRTLGLRLWERTVRTRTMWVSFWLLILTYVIPVSALQGLLQLQRLDTVPALHAIIKIPIIRSLLGGILPGLVLRLLLLIMPPVLASIVRRSGTRVSEGGVDAQVTTMFFIFQVVTVFLSSFIAGALLNQIQQFIQNPPSVLTVLGTGASQAASFFILYTLFSGLVVQPLQLLRPFGLLTFLLRYQLAATARARFRLWSMQYMPFGPVLPYHTIILLLCLVFANIHPLICPAALIYFSLVLCMDKYQYVYVFRRRGESGGRLWRQAVLQVLTGLYFAQLTLMGLLGIKRFEFAPVLLVPLCATVLFQRSVHTLFSRPWEALSLRDARDLDAEAEQQGEEPPLTSGGDDDVGLTPSDLTHLTKGMAADGWGEAAAAYWPPEERVLQDHDMVLADAQHIEQLLATASYLAPAPPEGAAPPGGDRLVQGPRHVGDGHYAGDEEQGRSSSTAHITS